MTNMQPPEAGLTTIHVRRSKFIDAFGQIETNVAAILKAGGISPCNTPMSQRLSEFRKLAANARLAKQNLGRRDQLAEKIALLMPVRTDIVHSVLTGCIVDGMVTAKLVNAQLSGDRLPPCRLLNESDFDRLIAEAGKIANDLLALAKPLNPASSPPPPSPGAAGDP
jgi:hypothetical protein